MRKVHTPERNFKPDELAEAREPSPGPRLLGPIAAQIVADLAFRRKVQRLHAKGARVLGELLAELGAERCLMSVIEAKLDRFLTVPDEVLDAIRGHDFPPRPLHEVRQ